MRSLPRNARPSLPAVLCLLATMALWCGPAAWAAPTAAAPDDDFAGIGDEPAEPAAPSTAPGTGTAPEAPAVSLEKPESAPTPMATPPKPPALLSNFNQNEPINALFSALPILPPDRANRTFDSTLKISGLPVEKFLILMSKPPFLDLNMVIATSNKSLENPVEIYLNEMTVGEAFNLVLQLNNLRAVRFNEKTLIIVGADDKKSYGVKQRKVFHLVYWLPSKLQEFIKKDLWLQAFFKETSFIVNDVQRSLTFIGTYDELTIADYLVKNFDCKPNKIHARVPISNLKFEDVKKSLSEMLPADIASSIDSKRWVYSESGHALLIYDDPWTVDLVRSLVKSLDIPPKQVLIDIALMEVSSKISRDIGLKLANSSFSVNSLDKLFSISKLRSALTGTDPTAVSVSYLLQESGGRTLASPKVRCLDGESADINIGEIRNVRVQSTEFTAGTNTQAQQTTFNTQEVPIGVQLTVKPEVHNDGTVSLDLTISDESIIAIQDFGVDRTTRNSATKLRIKDGETVIMGGFISQNRDWDKTPIPILGHLPLIGRLFRAGKRNKLESELVFLITPYILDLEKDESKRSFAKKTLADIKPGTYTQGDVAKSSVASQTTKWLEDKDTRTKLMFDAAGTLVFKQSWSKATGQPIGDTLDLRDQAQAEVQAAGAGTEASSAATAEQIEKQLDGFKDLLAPTTAPEAPSPGPDRASAPTEASSEAPLSEPPPSEPPPSEPPPAAPSGAPSAAQPAAVQTYDGLLEQLQGMLGGA